MSFNRKWIAWIALLGWAFTPFDREVLAASPQTAASPGPASPTNQTEAPSVLYGNIRSAKDQKPLTGVPIVLTNKTNGLVVTKSSDSQGAFIFSGLPAGDYLILVGGGNFSLQRKEGLLKSGTIGQMDFAVNQLSAGSAEILGHTFEGHGDHKIPLTATLAVKNLKTKEIYSVASDPSGTFDLKNIPAGEYLVQATKRGYLPYSQQLAVNGTTKADIRLRINRLAQADINATGNKKIKDTTGAITIVDHKTFETWQTTGIGFALSNQPGINYYSRSGANGVTGGMNYFTCRGYSTGGSNTAPSGGSNIEFTVEGVPFNQNQDGGMVYDLNLFNLDIASVDIQRGVTTSANLYNYASGCSVNIHLMQPTQDAYSQITSGMGSYGQYYTSFISNTGINENLGVGAYNDLSIINQQGFQNYTGLQEYQDYANLSKYLQNGKVSLMFTGAYKNYDRGASTSLQNFNQFGPSYNGLPNGENTSFPSGQAVQDSPYYKTWISQRYMITLQGEDQLNSTVSVKNNAFALLVPYGVIQVPVGINGGPTAGANGTAFQDVSPSYGGVCNAANSVACANPFNFTYIQGQGFKVGDIAETSIQTFKGNKVHMGARLSYNNTLYGNVPIGTNKITGNAGGSNLMTTIGGYLEDHYRPSDDWLLSAGFRVMAVNQQYVNSLMSGAQTVTNGTGNAFGTGNANYAASAGQSFVVPLPHVGVNWYPADHWKVYVNAGQSYSAPSLQFFQLAPGSPSNAVNIKPEIVNDAEIGARYTTDKGFVAFDFYNDYINNMFSTTIQVLPGGVTNTLPSSAGLAEMRGFEAQFKRDLPDGFSVDGSFSAVDAYFVSAQYGVGTPTVLNNSGDPLPFVPNMLGNLDLNYAKGNWHFTVNERYTGMMNVIDTSGGPNGTANIQQNAPGYWATNLLLAYDLPQTNWYKKAQLFFNAFNLLNTNYYMPAFLAPGANNAETLFVYPGEPINVFGGVTLTF
ncbi:MAG: TonB-dependent receptor [Leptospirales bacterium]